MITPAALANAADQNLVAHATASTRFVAGSRVEIAPDLVLVDSGLPCDTFNFVCRARLTEATAADRIRHALQWFDRTGHPFSWWHGPGSTPDSLPRRLGEAGLEAAETERVMGLDLSRLGESGRPPGLEIRRVRTPSDLASFAELSAANWQPPDPWVTRYFELARDSLLSPDGAQWLYLGLLDGRPVATAELTVGGGVVGLYNISTAKPARRRGIGTAMTHQPLFDARAAGHGWAILQASDDGTPVYRRLGFTELGVITEFKPVDSGDLRSTS
jgi:hypothetical protein